MAVLASQLAVLRLTPTHNSVCARLAITKNIQAQNYGRAAKILQVYIYIYITLSPLTASLPNFPSLFPVKCFLLIHVFLLTKMLLSLSSDENLSEMLKLCAHKNQERDKNPLINNQFCQKVYYSNLRVLHYSPLVCFI